MIFKPFIKKLRWHLNGEYITFNTKRDNGFKPRTKVLFTNALVDYIKTIVPYCAAANFHELLIGLDLNPFWRKGDKDVKKDANKKSR